VQEIRKNSKKQIYSWRMWTNDGNTL